MNTSKNTAPDFTAEHILPASSEQDSSVMPLLSQLCFQWLKRRFSKVDISSLALKIHTSESICIGSKDHSIPVPNIQINNLWAVLSASRRGLIGWAEAYMSGHWHTSDIRQVTSWAMANERKLEQAFQPSWLSRKLNRFLHILNDNSRKGSRRNIAAHYDLGNDFYKLWLDPGMTYSSALFNGQDDSLEQAQARKYDAVLNMLEITPAHKTLEIGCGWGGFAEAFAGRGGSSYLGITLSKEQLSWAQNRINHHRGFQFSLTDYRDIHAQFDRIASIEMIEAVGEAHWPTYFQKIYDALKPGGIVVLQVITIDDKRFEQYRTETDFIQKYIFPGGMLPSHSVMKDQITKAGMLLEDSRSFGSDYAKTLVHWYQRFNTAWPDIEAQGFDNRFRRMWNYYLAYCEAGFNSASIDVRFYKIRKPGQH